MSLAIQATLICDGCGLSIGSAVEHRATRAAFAYWEVKNEAKRLGWTTVDRGRYHVQTHWCPECSDKAMKPVPRKLIADS